MEPLLQIAKKHNLYVIEDTAQALGATYTWANGDVKFAGTMGTIGTTSFFPSKNLGAYGDGGAILTNDITLAEKIRMIANHGQKIKYHHDIIGVNSRLDTLQAAILNVKLRHLSDYSKRRNEVAAFYDTALANLRYIKTPVRVPRSTHVYHQYTLRIDGRNRDEFKSYLEVHGIPSMIYYPVPLHLQLAYRTEQVLEGTFPVSEKLSKSVISLPMHTEMKREELEYIVEVIGKF